MQFYPVTDYSLKSCFWGFVDVLFSLQVCLFALFMYLCLGFQTSMMLSYNDAVIILLIFLFCIHDFIEMMIMSPSVIHDCVICVFFFCPICSSLPLTTLPFSLGTKLIIIS